MNKPLKFDAHEFLAHVEMSIEDFRTYQDGLGNIYTFEEWLKLYGQFMLDDIPDTDDLHCIKKIGNTNE